MKKYFIGILIFILLSNCKKNKLLCEELHDSNINLINKIYKECKLDSVNIHFSHLNDSRKYFSSNLLYINDTIEIKYNYDKGQFLSASNLIDRKNIEKIINKIKENKIAYISDGIFYTKIQTYYSDTSYNYFQKYDSLKIDFSDKVQSQKKYDINCYCIGFIVLDKKEFKIRFDTIFGDKGMTELIQDSIYYYRDILTDQR